MIFDEIKNIKKYNVPAEAVEFVLNLTPEIECGKYILSDNVYASVNEYSTKNHEDCFFEAHKKYIDIQLLLKGEERLDFTFADGYKVKEEYNADKDIVFFYDDERDVYSLKLVSGVFAVLYPHEAHKPQMNYKENKPVKKVVVKIKA